MAGGGVVHPVMLMDLSLDVALLRGTICFLGAIDVMEEAF